MDGNTKEEFCTMCSVDVPSAFANEEEYDKDIKEKKSFKNICVKWSNWFLNLTVCVVIVVLIYFLFKKP
jgi:hypothetical protein